MQSEQEYLLTQKGTFYINTPSRTFLRDRFIDASLEDPEARDLERAILQADRERAALYFQDLAKKQQVMDKKKQQMDEARQPQPVALSPPTALNSLAGMSEMLRKEFDKVRTEKADVLGEEAMLFLDELHTFLLVHGASDDENAVTGSLLSGLMQMPSAPAFSSRRRFKK